MKRSTPTLNFEEFLASPTGQLLQYWDLQQFSASVDNLFGCHAVQVGTPWIHSLDNSRMQNRWLVCAENIMNCANLAPHLPAHIDGWIQANPERLPIANESVDLITLPHTLELSHEPQAVLREAVRALTPEGRLLLVGINPLGLWWCKQRFLLRLNSSPTLPSRLLPIAPYRLKDWLTLLELEVEQACFGIYGPTMPAGHRPQRWQFFDHIGDRWAPQLANLYFIQAVKRRPKPKFIKLLSLISKADKVAKPIVAPTPTPMIDPSNHGHSSQNTP